MNCIKNKLYILLLIAYAFPLGGIGVSGLNNMVAYDVNDSDGGFNLRYQDNGLEQGLNFFIYFWLFQNMLSNPKIEKSDYYYPAFPGVLN